VHLYLWGSALWSPWSPNLLPTKQVQMTIYTPDSGNVKYLQVGYDNVNDVEFFVDRLIKGDPLTFLNNGDTSLIIDNDEHEEGLRSMMIEDILHQIGTIPLKEGHMVFLKISVEIDVDDKEGVQSEIVMTISDIMDDYIKFEGRYIWSTYKKINPKSK